MPPTGTAMVVFSAASHRTKMVDMHPKEPLFIGTLYTGVINLWNYETQVLIRSFDTGTGQPIRCGRFIPRLQCFACGCDDMNIRIYNYNTMERVRVFQAHEDYIRSVAVHDQFPILLTCGDDMTIRQWDWSKGWSLQMTYQGHQHFCMGIAFNPKDSSIFATASMDCTVKVWRINNPVSNYQLEGHEDGVNCVEFYPRGDKPYLLSGSDDQTTRLWDYQTKACLQVFSFHHENVSAVLFHPDQPIIFSISEGDNLVAISTETFRMLYSCNHADMGRGWSLASRPKSNVLIAGFDNGVRVYRVGDDKPVYSMDTSGRVLVGTGNEITRMDIKGIPADTHDGDILNVPTKDMGTVESAARAILHAANGQFICVLDGEHYTIVSSLSLRPKSYGPCLSFVWGPENGSYAVLETSSTLTIYKGFKKQASLSLRSGADKLFGGPLLAVRTLNGTLFYDWGTLSLIRQIDEAPMMIEWSASNDFLALVTEGGAFLLRFNGEAVAEYLERNGSTDNDGLDFSFELFEFVEEKMRDVTLVGDCLVYIDQTNRLNYYMGSKSSNLAVLNSSQYLLGYLPKENRVFCLDKEKNITSYLLQVSVIEYMAAIVREDFETAEEMLPSIDASLRDKISRFVESRGLLDLALEISTDEDHRFDMAVQLKKLDIIYDIARKGKITSQWKPVGDVALQLGYFDIAIEALRNCNDWSGLLLIYTSLNDMEAVARLGEECLQSGQANVAFTCYHLNQQYTLATELLQKTGKLGEAAFYARTYCPELIEDCVARWKVSTASIPRVSQALANPSSYPNLFPMVKCAPTQRVPPKSSPLPTSPLPEQLSPANNVEKVMPPSTEQQPLHPTSSASGVAASPAEPQPRIPDVDKSSAVPEAHPTPLVAVTSQSVAENAQSNDGATFVAGAADASSSRHLGGSDAVLEVEDAW